MEYKNTVSVYGLPSVVDHLKTSEYEKIATFLCYLFTHRLENNVIDVLIQI